MISLLKSRNWLAIRIIVFVTIAIPVGITAYEFIVLGKDSVVFLGDYPSVVGVVVAIYYGILLIVGFIWIIKQLKEVLKLKNENRKNELSHLQSQVNPHFFFNMLNNLYGLVEKDSKKAQELILKLSELMRYSIYSGQEDSVSLDEEIKYLKNYIELHQMRYHKKIDVAWNTNITESGYKVKPLLFIILLENAFKHGVENLREDAYVKVNFKNGDNQIHFSVVNNFDVSSISEKQGIGLKNLKRRLQLVYPNKHSLSFSKVEGVYLAELNLIVG